VNCEYILLPWIWGISWAWLSVSLAVAHSRDFTLISYLEHWIYILLWHSWKQIPLANFRTVQMIQTCPTLNACSVVFQWLQTPCTEPVVSLSVKILATHPIQTKCLGTLYRHWTAPSQTILPSYFLNPMKTWSNVRQSLLLSCCFSFLSSLMHSDLCINFKFLRDMVHLLFLEQLTLICTQYQLMMVKYKPHTVSAIHSTHSIKPPSNYWQIHASNASNSKVQ